MDNAITVTATTATIMELIQCTNCKVRRTPDNFVGKKGQPVKRCLKCREKDDRYKQKEDVKEKRNERQREKKYYEAYREKKREENEDEYKKHQAENMRKWRANNSEKYSEWKKSNINARYTSMKLQAIKKNLDWEIDDDFGKTLMKTPCFYCKYLDNKYPNGIDRLDNRHSFINSNCVACCGTCNNMKNCLDPITFVERCIHIASHHSNDINKFYPTAWAPRNALSYNYYKKRAESRGLPFEFDKETFQQFQKQPCSYCKRPASNYNGIDRIDNSKGYTIDNCTPCCSECNYAKKDSKMDDFINSCIRVAQNVDIDTLPNSIPRCYRMMTPRDF